MNDFRKYIDSLKGNLPIDDENLLNEESVRKEMEKQWNTVPSAPIDSLKDKNEMWENISSQINLRKKQNKFKLFGIYGMIASVLLLISVGSFFFNRYEPKESIIYIVCTGNQDKNILTLDDGTKVKLGAGSRLTYPATFSGKERSVHLEGQAFFDVAKDTEKPFSVEIKNITVTALGTSFEVFHDKHNHTVETILLTGKVKIEHPDTRSDQLISNILYPNRKYTVSLKTGETHLKSENADKYSAWRNYNGLDFTDEKLSVIIPRLEYWYGCEILYNSEDIPDERFTFKVKNESLDLILDLMDQSASIGYKKNNDNSVYTLFRKTKDK
jgi:Fe2+-dicitrate sensor, membrane component